jgi:hypothetical protein
MHRPDFTPAELPMTARPRVRLPEPLAHARVFPGWGPELGR